MTLNRVWLLLLLSPALILLGCAPQQASLQLVETPLPTRFVIPTATPEYANDDYALALAQTYLDLWSQERFDEMYALLTPNSREAYSVDSFRQVYQTAHAEMRLTSVTTQPVAFQRDNERIATLTYNATFESALVGSFSDELRTLQVVIDHRDQAWDIAWSPGAIFSEMGEGAQLRLVTVQPRRGSIYDRNDNILADMNGRIVDILIVRKEIVDYEACMGTLIDTLGDTREEIEARLLNNGPDWLANIGVVEGVTYEANADALVDNCAAQFEGRDTRRYIYGSLYAHIIGNVGYPEPFEVPELQTAGFRQDNILGRSGIEASWDETLRGTPGGRLSIVNLSGDTLRVLAERGTTPATDVYLTIDTDLQRYMLERINQSYVDNIQGWGSSSRGASAVAIDPNTGEILGMVSYPTFDANAFTPFPVMGRESGQQIVEEVQNDARQPQLNRATQGRYPSGSTMKTFTAIAALDSGEYTYDERYYSTGIWDRDIPRVDWLGGGHGSLNLSQALTHSCNSCFYEAGYRLNTVDPYLLPSYNNEIGFGVDTGLTDIATDPGFIGSPDTKSFFHPEPWTFSDAVDIAIGQGMVEVSPLQMAVAYGQVATDGMHYRPQIVRRTGVGIMEEWDYEMTPELMHDMELDPELLEYLRDGLCAVTTASYGTAEYIFESATELMEDYGVCGKTGTAQNPQGLSHAWFASWAPAENPEVVVVVMLENAGEGSAVAAPIARDILQFYFYELPE